MNESTFDNSYHIELNLQGITSGLYNLIVFMKNGETIYEKIIVSK
jgi:hypothetical protein